MSNPILLVPNGSALQPLAAEREGKNFIRCDIALRSSINKILASYDQNTASSFLICIYPGPFDDTEDELVPGMSRTKSRNAMGEQHANAKFSISCDRKYEHSPSALPSNDAV